MFVCVCLCNVKSTTVDEIYHNNTNNKSVLEQSGSQHKMRRKKFGFCVTGKGPSLVHLRPQFVSFDSAFKEKAISQSQGGRTPSE